MRSKINVIIFWLQLMVLLFSCKYEKDPGLFDFNGPIQGEISDLETGLPVQGAIVKIEFEGSGFDPLSLYTDEAGFYSTEKININTDNRILIEASRMPQYDTLRFNGIDQSFENEQGVISWNAHADKWIVNFGLSEIKYGYQIIPDTLFYNIMANDPDGDEIIYQQLTVLNTETGQLVIIEELDKTWLFLDPDTYAEDPVVANEFHIFNIGVNRSYLTPGKHTGQVILDINGETRVIPVIVNLY